MRQNRAEQLMLLHRASNEEIIANLLRGFMKNKFSLLIFSLALLFFLGSFAQVPAYSIPCERYGNADAVFVGKYVQVDDGQDSLIDSKLYFEIEEAFYGIDNKTRVLIDVGNSIYYQKYKLGDSYLIYATTSNNNLSAPWGNSPVENASEDLKFLRNLSTAKDSGMKVFGKISEGVSAVENEELKRKIISNIKIRFQKKDLTKAIFDTFTDFDGKYEITLPAGDYDIEPVFPAQITKHLSLLSKGGKNIKAKDGGCFEKFFWIRNNVSISGRLLYTNGQPVENAFVSIVAEEGKINSSEETEKTDKSGRFKFEDIPIGRYSLVLNYLIDKDDEDGIFPQFFFPSTKEKSKAQQIEIKLGESPKPFEFRLPAQFTTKKVFGTLLWDDDSLADSVRVFLKSTDENSEFQGSDVFSDDDGKFVLTGFTKGEYFIEARTTKRIGEEMVEVYAKSEKFKIEERSSNFKLVLRIQNWTK